MRTLLILLLVTFTFYGVSAEDNKEPEAKVAYVALDDNGEDFVVSEREPPRDKVVAGARFTNAINETG